MVQPQDHEPMDAEVLPISRQVRFVCQKKDRDDMGKKGDDGVTDV